MLPSIQISLVVLLSFTYAEAKAPPGYVKPQEEPDKSPPKYEYGYNIEDEKGAGQGKTEARDGIFASGRYYVQQNQANQNVQYFADDWGYHPYVEYSNVGPHSKARAQFALGTEAVKVLQNSQNGPPPKDLIAETIQNRQNAPQAQALISSQVIQPNPPIFQQPLKTTSANDETVLIQQQPETVLVQENQPQTIYVAEQPPQPTGSEIDQPQNQQYILPSVLLQPESQVTNIVHNDVANQQQTLDTRELETAALYENADSTIDKNQDSTEEVSSQITDDMLAQQHSGSFGSKLNIQTSVTPSYLLKNTAHQTPSKLIETTRNLVTGQDVLNINQAADSAEQVKLQSTTPTVFVSEYQSGEKLKSSTESSLLKQPIIVEEIQENVVKSTTENYAQTREEFYSTTANTIETVSSGNTIGLTEPSTVLVTPRPLSTNFLAPITAGIQLQNNAVTSSEKLNKVNNVVVEIQKSVPYYLGKYEYTQQSAVDNQNVQKSAQENFQLGQSLLYFPVEQNFPKAEALVQHLPKVKVQQSFAEVSNFLNVQQLPEENVKEQFYEDQQEAQGINHQVAIQQVSVDKPVGYPLIETKVVEKPVQVTKVVEHPYPVKIPVPYPVETKVPIPVEVEKIVEKHVPVTQVVEKPVHIPQPYPVEKIVEKPIHIPIEVTKYVDRPYPVQVPVAHPVPYPVEKIVKQPYPVRIPIEVRIPVEKIVEKPVPVPHYIEKPVPVEKIVEKPVVQYIDRPYPVEVKVPVHVPQPYVLPVEISKPYPVQVTKYVQKPYIIQPSQTSYQQLPVVHPIATKLQFNYELPKYSENPFPIITYDQNKQQSQGYFYANPYGYAPTHVKNYLPPKKEPSENSGYLPPKNDQQKSASYRNLYFTIKTDDYIGLIPPKLPANANSFRNNYIRKYRNPRSYFGNNLKIEYGFMPPLIPSLEIDENGKPIEKSDEK